MKPAMSEMSIRFLKPKQNKKNVKIVRYRENIKAEPIIRKKCLYSNGIYWWMKIALGFSAQR